MRAGGRRCAVLAVFALGVAAATAAQPAGAPPAVDYRVVGDGIPEPVGGATGDPARGRALVVAREPANCLLCHAVPDPAIRFAGDVGPSLAGVGARLSTAQLRLRVVNSLRVNPSTIMPSYYNVEGLDRVASAYRGKPILTAAETEDVVAYLATLR